MNARWLRPLVVAAMVAGALDMAPIGSSASQASPAGPASAVPTGWRLASEVPSRFELAYDRVVAHGGVASGRLSTRPGGPDTVAAGANQGVRATAYRGMRVRVAGYVRAQDVGSAMLWTRVDGLQSDSLVSLALSNTSAHPITGTVDWQRVETIVDVPEAAEAISYGVLLRGGGELWLDDFTLNAIPRSTTPAGLFPAPVASREAPDEQRRIRDRWTALPSRPIGLDFEPVPPGNERRLP
jgi:hypothetical protein